MHVGVRCMEVLFHLRGIQFCQPQYCKSIGPRSSQLNLVVLQDHDHVAVVSEE